MSFSDPNGDKFVINDTFNLNYLFKLTTTDLKGECGGISAPFPSPKTQISWTNPPLAHGLSTASLPPRRLGKFAVK